MSCIPESKLAREAELAYTMICMSTDYDCWKSDEEAVTVETVMGNMKANSSTANALVVAVLEELVKDKHAQLVLAGHLQGSAASAVCTVETYRGAEEVRRRLEWLWKGEGNVGEDGGSLGNLLVGEWGERGRGPLGQ